MRATWVGLAAAAAACNARNDLQCDRDAFCDLSGGGQCLVAPTGNSWCAYPDPSCPDGYRYSDQDVGDGLSGQCVASSGTDGGVDAGVPSDMVLVPAGPFSMGCNASVEGAVCSVPEHADESPFHVVMLDAYVIDKLELSRAKYKECVDAQVCLTTGADMTNNLPAAVTWTQAATYCSWVGKRLPTEAEWEKAARGDDGRTFPWGNTAPNCALASFSDCGGGYVTVDSFAPGASPYGAVNMAGNISEWIRDSYQADFYVTSPVSNPSGPPTSDLKVLRGGNGVSPATELRVAERAVKLVTQGLFGVRCARSF